ncbi:hypothetical protein [Aquimarina sp. MMG016]|uniref:hypothetical protein n=1 Tax=Aquimarina sp. MMG016 TaxID=2822690 RepID=UPI001B3A258E|nr:hypothetical protein [Aquimarina sp. MMG016]MBQ4818610.1 hypothetical protein [Aquimarina sp. MMG016]
MIKIVYTFILLISTGVLSQSSPLNGVFNIKLNIKGTLIINNDISIELSKGLDSTEVKIFKNPKIHNKRKNNNQDSYEEKDFHNIKYISNSSFKKIQTLLENIQINNLTNNFTMGTDGTVTTVEFGNLFNSVIFNLWEVNLPHNTKDMSRIEMVISEILKIGEVDHKKVYY